MQGRISTGKFDSVRKEGEKVPRFEEEASFLRLEEMTGRNGDKAVINNDNKR